MNQTDPASVTGELQLRLLGPATIVVNGVPVEDRAWTRRKSKALVKILALAPHHQMHREQLMELLWPEQEPELAANNLNKALHAARRALEPQLKTGADSRYLIAQEQQISLRAPGGVWVDVESFEQQAHAALKTADADVYETALAIYGGELLEEDRYEDWAVARREQLQRLVYRLIARLAQLYETDEQAPAANAKATECWQRLLGFNATNEEAHRALMRLYACQGSRHEALAQYQRCREALRKELDAEPEQATIALHEQILAGHFQTTALAAPLPYAKQAESEVVGVSAAPPAAATAAKPRWLLGSVLLLALLAALGIGAFLYTRRQTAPLIEALAVLPFANSSNDANLEYLSDGITESLINSLSRLPNLRVLARTTAFRYKNKELDPTVVGQQLKVQAILTGRVLQRGDELLIQADLIDTQNGAQMWGERYQRKLTDLLSVQTEISREITERLRLQLSDELRQSLVKQQPANPEAYQNYLKGRYFWGQRRVADVLRAIDYFNKALQLDPKYALAYAGLADAWHTLSGLELPPHEAIPRVRGAAQRALELDDQLAAAHASLAMVTWRYDWQFDEAARGFQQAITLDPNYAPAHQWLGLLLTYRKRFDEGLRELRFAQQLDPLSSIINANVALPYYFERRYDEAIVQIKRALDLNQNFPFGHFFLGWAYEQKGEHKVAINEFLKAVEQDGTPATKAYLAHGYASAGNRAAAQAGLRELEQMAQQRYVSPYYFAVVHTGLGDQQQALAWLKRAVDEHADTLVLVNVEPKFDPLRSLPQFVELLHNTGLDK